MTVLIILSYWEGFRSAKFPLFIENIVMLIVALSGFCPIHFTVTFPGLLDIHRHTRNIVISRIVIWGFLCILSELWPFLLTNIMAMT